MKCPINSRSREAELNRGGLTQAKARGASNLHSSKLVTRVTLGARILEFVG